MISNMDQDWAVTELRAFIALTATYWPGGYSEDNRGKQDEIIASAQIVEKIMDRTLANWREALAGGRSPLWREHHEAAQRALTELERAAEVEERLGAAAPQLSAASFHPWAWEGARSLWSSGHLREAVRAAATKVNAELQNKVQRRDIADTKLVQESFSDEPPLPGKPRLRLPGDDGGQTAKSLRQGVTQYGAGCFLAIRNPLSHDEGEMDEQEALEHLAALSLLSRWIDSSTVATS